MMVMAHRQVSHFVLAVLALLLLPHDDTRLPFLHHATPTSPSSPSSPSFFVSAAVPASATSCTTLSTDTVQLSLCAAPWDVYTSLQPTPGDAAVVWIEVPAESPVLSASSAFLNHVNVTHSFQIDSPDTYSVTLALPPSVEWPWEGLVLDAVLVDSVSGDLFANVSSGVVVAGAMFTQEASALGMGTFGGEGRDAAVCVGDLNTDGALDVVVARWASPAQVWMNSGDGSSFTEVATDWNSLLVISSLPATSCVIADVDGDALPDLVMGLYNFHELVFYNVDGVLFIERSTTAGTTVSGIAYGLAVGDVDGDGAVDLYVCRTDAEANLLYMNDGEGVFTEDASSRGVAVLGTSFQASLADVNGDAVLDLIIVGPDTMSLFINDGSGDFTQLSFATTRDHTGLAVADITNDGALDIWITATTAEDVFLVGNPLLPGKYRDEAVLRGLAPAANARWGVAVADLELDGDTDVISMVRAGQYEVWSNDGQGGMRDSAGPLSLVGVHSGFPTVAVADLDNDGDLDLIFASLTGEIWLNHNARPGSTNWLKVRPVAASGAHNVFGAVVRVECVDGCTGPAAGWVGIRSLDGGSGYMTQNAYDAVFGLPAPAAAPTATYNISVVWPSNLHPTATWATHPALGSVVPSNIAAPDRVFVVRPSPLRATVGTPPVWTLSRGPMVDDLATIPVVLSPWHLSSQPDVTLLSATISGVDVSGSWAWSPSDKEFTLTYSTPADNLLWPWTGLDVSVTVVDSAGLLSTLSPPAPVIPNQAFTLSSTPFGTVTGFQDHFGACIFDVNGDGTLDVFMAVPAGPDKLWLNSGDGLVFEEVAAAWGVAGGGAADSPLGCGWADVNDDGFPDFIVPQEAGKTNTFYLNVNGTHFVEDGAEWGLNLGGSSTTALWFDADGDDRVDCYVAQLGDPNVLFMRSGDGNTFVDEAPARGASGSPVSRSLQATVIDVDSDGWVDIVVCDDTSPVLYLNRGGGIFADASLARGIFASTTPRALAVLDANGDGVMDLFVGAIRDVDLLFVANGGGPGRFAEDAAGRGLVTTFDGSSYGAANLDINNDGGQDLVIGNSFGSTEVWSNTAGGGQFVDVTQETGLTSHAVLPVLQADMDGDGDSDVVLPSRGHLYHSNFAHAVYKSWIRVRPTTLLGALNAFGATVRVRCSNVTGTGTSGGVCSDPVTSSSFVGAVTISSASSLWSQGGYDALVGVPDPAATYDVSVTFPNGCVQDQTTQPTLAGVSTATSLVVQNLPYVNVAGTEPSLPSTQFVNASSTVVVTLVAGPGVWRDRLRPADGCCWINGVQVKSSFVPAGAPGAYNLTYNVADTTPAGGGDWAAGALVVVAPVTDSVTNVSSAVVNMTAVTAPAADTTPPVILMTGGPAGAESPRAWEHIQLECPTEVLPGHGCAFEYRVTVNGAGGAVLSVPVANMTEAFMSAPLTLGPFPHEAAVQLDVWSRDEAGNVAATRKDWRVDLLAPTTTLIGQPASVSTSPDASFSLECSEDDCWFGYVLDGGPETVVGGVNVTATDDTSVGGGATMVDTLILSPPARVSNVTRPVVSLGVNISSSAATVNATVAVSLGGGLFSTELPASDVDAVQLPLLPDGVYELTARATAGDGTRDSTPATWRFTVDTTAPTAVIRVAPRDGSDADAPLVAFGCHDEGAEAGVSDSIVYMWRAGPATGGALTQEWQASQSGVVVVEGVVGGVRHAVEVLAVDAAGNQGPVAITKWRPVACPASVPDVELVDDVDPRVGARLVAIEVVAGTEPGSGDGWSLFEYALNDGEWVATPDPYVLLPGVALGSNHSVAIRAAVPPVCNAALAATRPPPRVLSWAEPVATPLRRVDITQYPAPATPSVFAQFEFDPVPADGTFVQYKLDTAEDWTPCGLRLQVGPLRSSEEHRIWVRAVDADGVPSAGGAVSSHTWTVTSASDSTVALSGLPDGVHRITVTARDGAGHLEVDPQTFTWRIDTVPPVTGVNRTSPAFTSSTTATVAVDCGSQELPPCTFCWKSTTLEPGCSTNTTLVLTAPHDGRHTVSVTATDAAGWMDLSPARVSWVVDATSPVISLTDAYDVLVPAPAHLAAALTVDHLAAVQTLGLNITSDEPMSGYLLTVHGVEWTGTVHLPVTELGPLKEGPTTITVTGFDLARNPSATATLRVLFDVTPPTTVIEGMPASPTAETNVAVQVGSVDGVGSAVGGGPSTPSGVAYTLVSATRVEDGVVVVSNLVVADGNGTAVLADLTHGTYNVTASGVDATGNVDHHPAWQLIVVDLVPPVSSFVSQPPAATGVSNVAVGVMASEPGCVTYGRAVEVVSGEAGAWVQVDHHSNGTLALSNLTHGTHRLEVYSIDAAGNVELPPYSQSDVFVVDKQAPVLAWRSTSAPFTQSPSVMGCVDVEDDTAVTVVTSPTLPVTADGCFTVTLSADGEMWVNVTAHDVVGNWPVTGLSTHWVLDRQPPTAVITAGIPEATSSSACTSVNSVVVCNSPTVAHVEAICDGDLTEVAAPCHTQFEVQTLEVAVGGVCAAPEAAISRRRLADGLEEEWSVGFGGSSANGGGGGRRQLYTDVSSSTIPLHVVTDGLYSVFIRAVDAAGNVQPDNTTLEWFVDTVPPATAPTLLQAPDKTTASTSAVFVVVLGDVEPDTSPGQTVFRYRLDGGPATQLPTLPVPNSAAVQLRFDTLPVNAHDIEIWAVDQAGNAGPSVVFDWTVLDTAPDLLLTNLPAAVSGDQTPVFGFRAVWGDSNDTEPAASVQVNLGSGFETVCVDTLETGGECEWSTFLSTWDTFTLSARAVLGGVRGDPVTYSWEYKQCGDLEVAVVDDSDFSIVCHSCPEGANCDGGLTQADRVGAVTGWWLPPESSGLKFYQCPMENACLPGGEVVDPTTNDTLFTTGRCAEGYEGTLCAVCADGFFEQFGACRKCEGTQEFSTAVPFLVIIAMSCAGALLWRYREILPRDTTKVVFTDLQIIVALDAAYTVPWPPLFGNFLQSLQVFVMDLIAVTRAQCAQPMTYFTSTILFFVVFKAVFLPLAGATYLWRHPAVRRWRYERRRRAHIRKAIAKGTPEHKIKPFPAFVPMTQEEHLAPVLRATFFWLFVMYSSLSLRSLRIFKCVEVGDEWWLVADYRLRCYTREWLGIAIYSSVMGVIFVLGLPLLIFVILYKRRHVLWHPHTMEVWGFLYQKYGTRHSVWLWEVEELLRRLSMVAAPVLFSDTTPMQVSFGVVAAVVFWVLHAHYRPWKVEPFQPTFWLQHLGLGTIFFVYLLGLLFKVEGIGHDTPTFHWMAVVMVGLVVVFLVVGFVRAAVVCRRGLKAQRIPQAAARRQTMAALGLVPSLGMGTPGVASVSSGGGTPRRTPIADSSPFGRFGFGRDGDTKPDRFVSSPLAVRKSRNGPDLSLGGGGGESTDVPLVVHNPMHASKFALAPAPPANTEDSTTRLRERAVRQSLMGPSGRLLRAQRMKTRKTTPKPSAKATPSSDV